MVAIIAIKRRIPKSVYIVGAIVITIPIKNIKWEIKYFIPIIEKPLLFACHRGRVSKKEDTRMVCNRITKEHVDIQQEILKVYEALGAFDGLMSWAKEHEKDFYSIFAKAFSKSTLESWLRDASNKPA